MENKKITNIKKNSNKSLLRKEFNFKTIAQAKKFYNVNTAEEAYTEMMYDYNFQIDLNKQYEQKEKAKLAREKKKKAKSKTNLINKLNEVVSKKKTQTLTFGLTFYVLIEDQEQLQELQAKGRPIIFYDGKYWFKRSRTNAENSSSYYAEIKTKFPQIYAKVLNSLHYCEYPPLNEIEQNKTDRFLNILKMDYTDFIALMEKIRQSYGNLLVEIKNVSYKNTNTEPISYIDADAFDDVNMLHISNIYTSVNNELKINDYVKSNFKQGSCWLNLIINLFKEPIEKYYKNVKITYQYIHDIISPSKTLKQTHNGYSFNEVKLFFEKYKIALVMFDVNLNVVSFYEPDKRNKHINPVIIYVVYHNKHIYHLNQNLKSLEQKLETYMNTIEEQNCKKPSSKYYLKVEDETKTSYLVNNYTELMEIVKNEEIDEPNVRILYNKPSCFDLWIEAYKNKIEMKPLMTNGEVCFKYLRFYNYKLLQNKVLLKVQYDIYTLEEEGVYSHKDFDTIDIFTNYVNSKSYASNYLLTINYLSQYSYNVGLMLDKYMKAPLKGRFLQVENNTNSIHIDYNKFYTSILQKITHIPVVNSFDDFVEYINQPIIDYNLYFVEKIKNDTHYPFHKFSLCYGMNIKNVKNINILKFLQVSKIKEFNGKKVIKNIYDNVTLTPQFRKDIINHIVGKYNKKDNKKYFTTITNDEAEANYVNKNYGGKLYHQVIELNEEETNDDELDEDEDEILKEILQKQIENHNYNFDKDLPQEKEKFDLYINQVENETKLTEGFRLLSLLVYDIAYKNLLDLKQSVEETGLKVYGCNTDCLYIEDNKDIFEKFKQDNYALFDFKNKNDYEAIGKLKVESKEFTFNTNIKIEIENITNELEYEEQKNIDIPLINEFDNDEITEVIENNNNLQITAVVAGAGKTTAFINYAIKSNKKMLIIAPYNTLCFDLNTKAKNHNGIFESITIYKLFGLVFDGTNTQENKPYDLSDVKIIVFDEIYLLTINDLMRVKDFMKKNSNIKFYATGDEYQNAPIENNLYIDNHKEYFNKIVSYLFPNKIILQENKRCNNDKDRATIKALSFEIRNMKSNVDFWYIVKKYNIKTTDKIRTYKNVCALNKTCEWINNEISNVIHKKKNIYFVGQQLICRKTIKKQYRTFINFTYTITEEKEKSFILTDGFNTIELSKDDVKTSFRLPYARTCHSYQGLTETEAMTIFDIDNYMVDKYWIYTAITRTTSLKNIYVYTGNIPPNDTKGN